MFKSGLLRGSGKARQYLIGGGLTILHINWVASKQMQKDKRSIICDDFGARMTVKWGDKLSVERFVTASENINSRNKYYETNINIALGKSIGVFDNIYVIDGMNELEKMMFDRIYNKICLMYNFKYQSEKINLNQFVGLLDHRNKIAAHYFNCKHDGARGLGSDVAKSVLFENII